MKKIIDFCNKHRIVIGAILTITVLLLLCFPIRNTVFPTGSKKTLSDYDPAFPADKVVQTPFFFASFYWFNNASQYSLLSGAGKQFFFLQIFAFAFLMLSIISCVIVWISKIKSKNIIAGLSLVSAFISHTLLCFRYVIKADMTIKLSFFVSPSFVIFIVLICLYFVPIFFENLYPYFHKKFKSDKKFKRLEKLEKQSAEIQREIDKLRNAK